jgi:hypothetical protein
MQFAFRIWVVIWKEKSRFLVPSSPSAPSHEDELEASSREDELEADIDELEASSREDELEADIDQAGQIPTENSHSKMDGLLISKSSVKFELLGIHGIKPPRLHVCRR